MQGTGCMFRDAEQVQIFAVHDFSCELLVIAAAQISGHGNLDSCSSSQPLANNPAPVTIHRNYLAVVFTTAARISLLLYFSFYSITISMVAIHMGLIRLR